jgi:DNA-binding response OmpR family regulator
MPFAPSQILTISPIREDQATLDCILRPEYGPLRVAATARAALGILRRHPVRIVVCVSDLPDGTWIDVLERIQNSPKPPLLIVASRLADNRLWIEALNLGAFDVISKPFLAAEVNHVVKSAMLRTELYGCSGKHECAAAIS